MRVFLVFFLILGLFCFINPALAQKTPPKQPDEIISVPKYEIIPYNRPPGDRELNLYNLGKKNQLNLNAVTSPDFKYMAYTEVYTYPQNNSTMSSIFLIELNQYLSDEDKILKAFTSNKIVKPVIESNFTDVKDFLFNTYTIVDWNIAGDKLFIKEKIGKNFDRVYATNLYVYDVEAEKLYKLEKIRNFILSYWESKRKIWLDDYKWDIQPIGWDASKPARVIVRAYGYYQDKKKFLGTWSCGYNGKSPALLSLDETKIYQVSQNGLCLISVPD